MKIVFLLNNAYALGGTVRAVFNLASALADRHEVQIASLRRHRESPYFPLHHRVDLVPLVDDRPGSDDRALPAYATASRAFPAADHRCARYRMLHDQRADDHVNSCGADVIVGTRAGINIYLARHAPATAVAVGQEHLHHDAYTLRLWQHMARSYHRLNAVVTTTHADAQVYRSRMPLGTAFLHSIPNIVPAPGVTPSDQSAKVIAAAGRLVPDKRHDLLLHAFAHVHQAHPDWQLRLYGSGPQLPVLQELAHRLGLADGPALRFMGPVVPIEPEFARASLVTVTSDVEPFGMTIVEAMRCGVPVVATDAPHGPAEIIQHERNGLLVPVDDPQALALALNRLIANRPLRRAMGAAALAGSHRYDPGPVAAAYESLFQQLLSRHGSGPRSRRPPAGLAAKLAPRLRKSVAHRLTHARDDS